MDDLYQLLREDALELESKFRRASIEGKGTSQEIADFREHALQDFVQRFFPFPHRVTKGKVRDTFGAISDSVDCIVCNPNHPYTVDTHGKFRLIFAEGVDAAIEVKPDIGASTELLRGLEQGLSVKALKRRNPPTLMRGGWEYDRAFYVPYVVFAMRCKSNPLDTLNEISAFYASRHTPPLQQADFVAVNGAGLFVNYSDPGMYCWSNKASVPVHTGWFFEKWAEDSLAGFVWRLQMLAHASIKMQADLLPYYLQPTAIQAIVRAAQ
jgi:hypothetical protein